MKYTTRFGKVIEIDLDKFLTMSDEELQKLEEYEGTSSNFDLDNSEITDQE